MPLGCYFNCQVSKPRSLAGKRAFIGTEDAENAFYSPNAAGDYGGRRGIYNPSWWPGSSTQYGELHRLVIRPDGCFGDDRKTSDCDTGILKIKEGDYISFKIGINEGAEYIGGVNLFGECFGNFKQNIEMTAKLER
jgi:predicted transcriptional regulator